MQNNGVRPKLFVVSHERSGTHFLMNAIAKCFGYVADPFINFDVQTVQVNFHWATGMENYFSQFHGQRMDHIFKSHHPFQFFEKSIHALAPEFQVFYVYRDPRDVMVSYWRFLNQLPWHEGPKTTTAKEFIRSAPSGRMLRYQWEQEASVLHRWRSHVDSWTLNLPQQYRSHVTFVRFRDLYFNYEDVVNSISPTLGPIVQMERPDLHTSTVLPHKGIVGGHKEHFDSDDLELFRDVAGPTMERLGYDS